MLVPPQPATRPFSRKIAFVTTLPCIRIIGFRVSRSHNLMSPEQVRICCVRLGWNLIHEIGLIVSLASSVTGSPNLSVEARFTLIVDRSKHELKQRAPVLETASAVTGRFAPKYFKVTQLRSAIALPKQKKDTLLKLGLRKRHQTVYHKICPQQAGMIAVVKELVKVELSDEKLSKEELHQQRKSNPGFTIERATASPSNAQN
ncbi:hypothetical protein OGAPHI_004577 [Ogataea philodendri]|uniref:Large ribosomal subunit protein uL30m n=1 Tax=Ogataea philodendri TaxID=1378263 RepID=A0A9P8P383_9ASCO|nr:uncharacterized protein OGAPHI_004577 [Ogataea philodendri]KAH3664226.1 hypothetical protein OGAPHI_004577 [Ogataea philodendri]